MKTFLALIFFSGLVNAFFRRLVMGDGPTATQKYLITYNSRPLLRSSPATVRWINTMLADARKNDIESYQKVLQVLEGFQSSQDPEVRTYLKRIWSEVSHKASHASDDDDNLEWLLKDIKALADRMSIDLSKE